MAKLRQIPWTTIFAESAAIVASILLACWIDAWWEERTEREIEREQLVAMRAEFAGNLEALERLQKTISGHAANVEQLIAMLKSAGDDGVEVPAQLLGSAIMWRTSDVSTSTLDALLASGGLNVLQNAELRTRLAGLPAVLNDLTEDEALSRDFAESEMAAFVVREGLAEIAYANRLGFMTPTFAELGTPKSINVKSTPELIGLLSVRRVHFAYAEEGFPKVQTYFRDLITQIDAELVR